MIKSMTGYGRAKLSKDDREYQIEIKSVNHRYLDISVRIPKQLSYLEETIKKEIAKKVKRGKIDVFVTFENNSLEGKEIKINTELAKANLVQMRETEGNKISEDLLKRLNIINKKVEEIAKLSTGLIEEYVVKLEERINEILKNQEIDKTRLAQEVVIYADKCSIEEEVTRLNSHISQFKNLLNSNEAIGKKLDFIIQEMNRETNTIGSKANNLEITNGVIDIKTEIENIREQVQNIE